MPLLPSSPRRPSLPRSHSTMFTGGRGGVSNGAIKEKLRHEAGTGPILSRVLALVLGHQVPGLQPHLERTNQEIDTSEILGLQGGQGAIWWWQQREGLEQARQDHEELQSRQRLSQAHTGPTAEG